MTSDTKTDNIDGGCVIISGRFQEQTQAEHAVAALKRAGFAPSQIASFYVGAAGQHDLHPFGGDEEQSPGTEHAPRGAAQGAALGAVAGVISGGAALPVLGPVAIAAGITIGAWAGSLYGALSATDETATPNAGVSTKQQLTRKSGMLVAVAVDSVDHEREIVDVLRGQAAFEIARGRGWIERGQWNDFDPLELLHRI